MNTTGPSTPFGLRRGSLRLLRVRQVSGLAEPKLAKRAKAGGARRDRTADLVIANDALSQLSYGPSATVPGYRVRSAVGAIYSPRQGQVKNAEFVGVRIVRPGSFPCLAGGEPIFSGRSNPRPNPRAIPRMRAVLDIVLIVLDLYVWLLIASAILSWLVAFNVVNTRNAFVAGVAEFLYRITEPVLAPIRNIMPNLGGLDISPIILILIIMFIQKVIVYYIYPAVF
jgi:YggT family protein